jgi:2-dehydropantoate 2-reductase
MKDNNKKILVIWWTIWLRLSVSLFNKWYDVLHIWRRKVQGLWDSITMDWKTYKLPIIQTTLPSNQYFDVVFVATKLYDTQSCIAQLAKNNITYGTVAVIQNGLVPKNFYSAFDLQKIISLSIVEGVQLKSGKIITTPSDQWWQVPASPQWERIAKLLRKSEVPYTLSYDIQRTRTRKMLMNCTLNCLSAIYNATVAELLDGYNEEMISVFNESYDILHQEFELSNKRSYQISLRDSFQKIRRHYTTTHQDVTQHRKTEIEYLNGYIIQLWKKHWIPTPMNQQVYNKIKKIEDSYL